MVKSAATFKQNKKEIAIKPSASSEGKRKRDENIFVETDNGHDEPMDNEDVDFEQTAATSGKRKKVYISRFLKKNVNFCFHLDP